MTSALIYKRGTAGRTLDEPKRIYQVLWGGTWHDTLREWLVTRPYRNGVSWERYSSDYNKFANRLRWKEALRRLPIMKIDGQPVDNLPTVWVNDYRRLRRNSKLGDDDSGWVNFTTVRIPVARPFYSTEREEVPLAYRRAVFLATGVWPRRYNYRRVLHEPVFVRSTKSGFKLNTVAYTFPTKIYRIVPTGMYETFKSHKVPGRRNLLYYYSTKEANQRGVNNFSMRTVTDIDGYYSWTCELGEEWQGAADTSSMFPVFEAARNSLPGIPWLTPQGVIDEPIYLPTLFDLELAEVNELAKARLHKSIVLREVNYATELAQIRQTVSMFVDLVKRLAKILTALKHGDLIGVEEALFLNKGNNSITNDFLMFQFGIRPLVEDVNQLAKHILHFMDTNAVVHAEGHAKKLYNDAASAFNGSLEEQNQKGQETCSGYVSGYSFTANREYEIRVKYSVDLGIIDRAVRDSVLLGLSTPEETVWELTPYSFVLDWFANIGTLLETLHSLDGVVPLETWKTTFIKSSESGYEVGIYYPPWADRVSPNGFATPEQFNTIGFCYQASWWRAHEGREAVYCTRELVPFVGLPTFQFKSPFSTYHVAEAIALIAQLKK